MFGSVKLDPMNTKVFSTKIGSQRGNRKIVLRDAWRLKSFQVPQDRPVNLSNGRERLVVQSLPLT